jgi:hypothetical protein
VTTPGDVANFNKLRLRELVEVLNSVNCIVAALWKLLRDGGGEVHQPSGIFQQGREFGVSSGWHVNSVQLRCRRSRGPGFHMGLVGKEI